MVIADSSVWIAYLRDPESGTGQTLANLIRSGGVGVTGMVLAEVAQGGRTKDDFAMIVRSMEALPYFEMTRATWVRAASIASDLRRTGRLIPLTDLAIAALALEGGHEVFTLDGHFARVPNLRLYMS